MGWAEPQNCFNLISKRTWFTHMSCGGFHRGPDGGPSPATPSMGLATDSPEKRSKAALELLWARGCCT